MGREVDLNEVAGLVKERHGELGVGRDRGMDELSGRRINGYTVAFDESADIERTVMGKDDIRAFAVLVGLGEASEAERKAAVMFAGLDRGLVVLVEQVGITLVLIVYEPNVLIPLERLFFRQAERDW